MSRMRADLLLVKLGLAQSRAQAQEAIHAGLVAADGRVVRKASEEVEEGARVTASAPHPYVSRGGVKLAHALDVFAVDPARRICLDVGASTGGFTDVLLRRGAARVYAVDVGRDQLDARIAADPRVINLEQHDARVLAADDMPEAPTLIVCDVSFIGAAKALAVPLALAAPAAELVALVKPQFESGPGVSRRGVLSEEAARIAFAAARMQLDGLAGFAIVGEIESPIRGGDGNREFLIHARRAV